MARSSIPPALLELRSPTSPSAQVEALRDLKNEIVGHDQRKELAVRHGVVAPLARILRAEARRGGKRRARGGVANGSTVTAAGSSAAGSSAAGPERREREWGCEEEMRLQATVVVGSLALGE